MGAPIASLVVRLGVNSGPFAAGLKKAGAAAAKWGTGLAKAAAIGAGAAVAAVGGLTAAVLSTAQTLDEIGKKADAIGIATEPLIGLSHAAEQGGASAKVMENALATLQRRAQEGAEGNKTYARAIESMGVSVEKFRALPAEQKLRVIADEIASTTDGARRNALAFNLLGKAGGQLIPTLQGGAEGLDRLQGEAERLGLTVDRQTIAALEAFHDSLDTTKKIGTGAMRQVTAALAPVAGGFTAVARHIVDSWSFSAKGSKDFVFKLASFIAEAINFATKDFEAFFFHVDKGWTSLKLSAYEAINAVLRGVGQLTSALPERVQAFLGLSGKPLQIDTSEVKQELVILEQFIRDIYNSKGLGDVFFDGFTSALEKIETGAAANPPVVNIAVDVPETEVRKATKKAKAAATKIAKAARPAKLSPLAQWFDDASHSAERLEGVMADTLTTLSEGLGQATAQAIFFSDNFGDGLLQLFRQAGAQIVATLVDIGVRMALTALLGDTLMASTAASSAASISAVTATSSAAAATNASLWSTAAYFASVATLGGAAGVGLAALLSGLAAATAAQVAATAVTAAADIGAGAISKAVKGQAHDGLSYVPSTGTYNLQTGERVVGAALNADLTSYLADGGAGGGLTIINNAGVRIARRRQDGRDVLMLEAVDAAERRVTRRFRESLATGSGAFARALRRAYGRRRK